MICYDKYMTDHTLLESDLPPTGRKRTTTEELEEKLRAAERLGYVGGSVRKLAHELRNPLNTIYLNLQLLQEDCKKYNDAKMSRRLDSSLKEVQRLEHILSEFLHFARSSIQKLQPQDINPLIETFVDFIQPTSDRDKIKVSTKLQKKLPWVLMDENLFRSILMNLYLNSAAAMPDGGKFTIRTRRVKSRVLITITDTGKGIPPEILPRVFDIFFTTKTGGSGLGLSITRRAVEDLGGTVTLDSTVGSGTTVIFSLPIAMIPVIKPPMLKPGQSPLEIEAITSQDKDTQ